MKGFLEDFFATYQVSGVLILKLTAQKVIIDHSVSYPEIFSKAMCPKIIKKGFIINGMIDGKTHTYPGIIKTLQTCTQEVKQD